MKLNNPDQCGHGEFQRSVRLRNQISPFIVDPVDIMDAKRQELLHNGVSEVHFDRLVHIADIISDAVTWRELSELCPAESEFYCATLDLIAAMCAGRNQVTQSVVRQLIPVDHILLGIDERTSAIEAEGGRQRVIDSLRPIRTALLNVLFHCYIDSAMLPPIPMTGLDSVIRDSGSSTTDVDAEAESWDDVYIDEVFIVCVCFFLFEI